MIGTNLSIKDDLDELDEIVDDSIFGKGLLTFPSHISSVRHGMFAAQTEQLVNVKNPDFPLVFTNYENVIGEFSSAYLRADTDYNIIAKIEKFPGLPDTPYILVLRDLITGKFHVEQRQVGRRLTEHYGYHFNNTSIDSFNEGETIKKDTVLYHSTSYDDAMNYRYGINVDCVYMIEAHTIEDAYFVSQSTAERLSAYEYDDVSISLNDNDVLINYHGNDKTYKSFPDIGDHIKDGIIAVKRRIDYSRILYDFKKENLRVILDNSSDTPYYVKGTVKDIDIYSNRPIEDLMNSECNGQIIHYLRLQNAYYTTIISILGEIIESGATCSDDLTYLYRRASDIMNPDVKWRTGKNKIYNNLIINFFVEHECPATEGLKLCGRFG